MMKALRFHGAKDLRLDDVSVPNVTDRQVKVKPSWTGICGTDLHEYLAGPNLIPKEPHPVTGEKVPLTLGHEFSGIVEEVGQSVTRFKTGDRVVIEPIIYDGTCPSCKAGYLNCCAGNGFIGISGYGGGFAEHIVLDERFVEPLPDDISLKVGALIEPLAVAWRAVAAAGSTVGPGTTALVVGGGPIGLAVVLVLRAVGVATIVLSEMAGRRKALARELGASHVLDPAECDVLALCREACGGEGADVAFDCAGVQASLDLAVDAVRSKGVVVNVAVWEKMPVFPMNALLFKEKKLVGTAAPEHGDFVAVMKLLREGRLKPEALVTKCIGLHEVEKGFKTLIEDKENHVKILVEIGGGD